MGSGYWLPHRLGAEGIPGVAAAGSPFYNAGGFSYKVTKCERALFNKTSANYCTSYRLFPERDLTLGPGSGRHGRGERLLVVLLR